MQRPGVREEIERIEGESVEASSRATYERARRLASMAAWSVDLQCRRLASTDSGDDVFVLRRWTDFDFLIVALTRLRRACTLAARVPQIRQFMLDALSEFDTALPDLKRMRDVAEHVDEYAINRGRRKMVDRLALEVSAMSHDGSTLEWLGARLNTNEASQAAQNCLHPFNRLQMLFLRWNRESDA